MEVEKGPPDRWLESLPTCKHSLSHYNSRPSPIEVQPTEVFILVAFERQGIPKVKGFAFIVQKPLWERKDVLEQF